MNDVVPSISFRTFLYRHLYRHCHRLLKIQYVIAIYVMRWLTNLYHFGFKWTATAAIGIHPTKAWLSQLMNFKNVIWHFRRKICNKILFYTWKKCHRNVWNASDCFWTILHKSSISFWVHKIFKEGRKSARDDERCGRSKEVNTPELIGQRVRVSGISTRIIHQSITTSLSQTIWPRWASRQFLTLRIVQTLLSVTFGYSLSPEAVVMRQLRRWKRLWRRSMTRSQKRTSMGVSRSY